MKISDLNQIKLTTKLSVKYLSVVFVQFKKLYNFN
jgi:hypothetical protein